MDILLEESGLEGFPVKSCYVLPTADILLEGSELEEFSVKSCYVSMLTTDILLEGSMN